MSGHDLHHHQWSGGRLPLHVSVRAMGGVGARDPVSKQPRRGLLGLTERQAPSYPQQYEKFPPGEEADLVPGLLPSSGGGVVHMLSQRGPIKHKI